MGYILVVEDNIDLQESVCCILTFEGYENLPVANGLEALQAIANNPPRLIILDLYMPVMDGYEFLKQYCQGVGPFAPVIVYSSAATSVPIIAGCTIDFLKKPFEISNLLELVKKHLAIPALA